jgi:hypothetical protein
MPVSDYDERLVADAETRRRAGEIAEFYAEGLQDCYECSDDFEEQMEGMLRAYPLHGWELEHQESIREAIRERVKWHE